MGHYCHVNAHFPVDEFSEEEQRFLRELRHRLPPRDEWLKLSWDEQRAAQEQVHIDLGIPAKSDDWKFVEQWQREGKWYVTGELIPALSPPFPRVLTEYYPPYNKNHLSPVWLVAFTAPGRWQPRYWSIYQTLSETRRHAWDLFNKLWGLFYIGEYFHEYTDAYDLREIRRKAPPGSVAHKRLRSVFSLFKLHDFVSLHRQVLSRDLPNGTILELDILDYLYSGTEEEAKAKFQSDQELAVLDAVEKMDLQALVGSKLLESLRDYDEDVIPWLDAADGWCEAAMYLREEGGDE
jgi:hypothetical protein